MRPRRAPACLALPDDMHGLYGSCMAMHGQDPLCPGSLAARGVCVVGGVGVQRAGGVRGERAEQRHARRAARHAVHHRPARARTHTHFMV